MSALTAVVQGGASKKLVLALLLVIGLAVHFWTTSRYPSLDEKAMMSGAIQLEDPLGFEAHYPLTADMTVPQRIGYSTLNWIHTNRKGMTFGILFGAAFLTLIGYLKRRSFRRGWANSFLGMFIGAPLGVCVNCAAPIAKGLYSGGMRAETVLSAMMASPTLNVVVLTMLFSLLPVYMALTKIALSLLIILVAVPLICRLLPGAQLEIAPRVPAPTGWDLPGDTDSLPNTVLRFAVDYLKNLWFIVKTTVPLMLLAGFLGAVVATLLPGDALNAAPFGLGLVVLAALVGTFLPVPIAFDVVVTGALLTLGLQPGYVMALLFTLGSFSIYSWFIVQSSISARAANMLAVTVVVLGILSGLGAQTYHNWQSQRALDLLLSVEQVILPAARAQDAPAVQVTATPFAPRSPAGDMPFTRIEGHDIGIGKPIEFSFRDMWPPFWEGRSLSTGDIDHDGDMDLVIASTQRGLYLYANDGAGQFAEVALPLGPVADMPVFLAALEDIDNDGWLDLFLSTYRQGNHVVPNRGGVFDFAAMTPVANVPNAVMTLAATFSDADRDGDLDVALGNWASGWYRRIPGEESRNRVVWNRAGVLDGADFADLPGMPGETLSILFSDINGDALPDLIVGNDFEVPDYFYLGDGAGGFAPITAGQGIIPHSSNTTMAAKTADLHNDGVPEIYMAQIAGRSSGVSKKLKMQPLGKYCDGVTDATDRATCDRNMAIKDWYKSGNNFDPTYAGRCQGLTGRDQGECKAMVIKDLAIQRRDPSLCALIPAGQPEARSFCEVHFWPQANVTQQQIDEAIPQVLRSNVLLERGADGRFSDMAEARGLEVGGWSWDTKIEDFDNDGYLDVYIVNGTWVPNEVSPSNLFFRNTGDGGFKEASGPFGLEDYLMTAAAVATDMDGDGDLDIITHPVNGPITVFRNNDQTGNAIAVDLRDGQGNSQGIGALVELLSADDRTQGRELQSGGGFMSFDAPVAHFGLGAATQAAGLRIRWADGGQTMIDGPLMAGNTYRITRP